MYTLSLTKEQLTLHVRSMDSAIRVLCTQIANNQNSIAALRNALPDLQQLNNELMSLDKIIDEQETKDAGSAQVSRETQEAVSQDSQGNA